MPMMFAKELLRDGKGNIAKFQTIVQCPAQSIGPNKDVVDDKTCGLKHPLCTFSTSETLNGINPPRKVPFATSIESEFAGFKENVDYIEVRIFTATGASFHKASRKSGRLFLVPFMEET